jgi:hypothetical protein
LFSASDKFNSVDISNGNQSFKISAYPRVLAFVFAFSLFISLSIFHRSTHAGFICIFTHHAINHLTFVKSHSSFKKHKVVCHFSSFHNFSLYLLSSDLTIPALFNIFATLKTQDFFSE